MKQVNTLDVELSVLRAEGRASGRDTEFAELTRRLGFEYNRVILHEYYFSNLRPGGHFKPSQGSSLGQALTGHFGSPEESRTDFHAIGARRGVGWAILCEDPATGRLSNHWNSLHHVGVPAGCKPLVVMDVWEHAFMRDYKASERGRYIDAFFRNVDWDTVERRPREPAAVRPAAAA